MASRRETRSATGLDAFRRAAIDELPPEPADLLALLAFYAPDDVPLDMLVAGRRRLPRRLAEIAADEADLQDTLSYLEVYGLVEIGIDTISVPPAVHAAARKRLSARDAAAWAGAAVATVSAALPPRADTVEAQDQAWDDIAPHALAAAREAEAQGVCLAEAAKAFHLVGARLAKCGGLADARTALESALRISRTAPEVRSARVVRIYRCLGCVLRDLGKPAEARECFDQACRITEADSPPSAVDLADEPAAAEPIAQDQLEPDLALAGASAP